MYQSIPSRLLSRLHSRLARTLVIVVACVIACGPVSAGKVHEHGAVKLNIAIEGTELLIIMEAPLNNLLGFERRPRTDEERQAAAAVLTRLRGSDKGVSLFTLDAAAQCRLKSATVQAPVIEPELKSGTQTNPKGGHADLDASYEFSCATPGELRMLGTTLFSTYKRIQRIDVQVIGPNGQSKLRLKRPDRQVPLAR
ncbi:MAG: DUF2796 domain-containing protein [Burkholderiaceae bacterium]